MKLTEYNTKYLHYFRDEQDRLQGEYTWWHSNGRQRVICHYRDNELHGKFKEWYKNGQQRSICHFRNDNRHGEFKQWNLLNKITSHYFYIDGEKIIDFLKNPELYPTTPEERLMFALNYGNVSFLNTVENIHE